MRKEIMLAATRPRLLLGVLFVWVTILSAYVAGRDNGDRARNPEIYETHPQTGVVWSLGADPTVAPGLNAPMWQFLIRTDQPELYFKSGTGNTDWTLLGNGSATIGLTAVFRDSPLAGSGTSSSHLTWSPTLGHNLQGTGSAGSALNTIVNPSFTTVSIGTGPGILSESPGVVFVSEALQATDDITSGQDITAHGNVEANQTLQSDTNLIVGTTIEYDANATPVDVKASNGDPNGLVSAHKGSLDVDFTGAKLYQNTTGGTIWTQVGAPTTAPFFDTILAPTLTGPGTGTLQVDDWNPGALGTNTFIRLFLNNAGFNVEITGIAGGAAGKTLTVCDINTAFTPWQADNESGSSSAVNRMLFRSAGAQGGQVQSCFSLWYDTTVNRWRGFSVN